MINVVVPMAGAGTRFAKAGYKEPKPFIDVLGKPMIQWVIENLSTTFDHRFIFICQKEHRGGYGFEELLEKICPDFQIITVDGLTQGAAETVLLASKFIDNGNPLIIANSDQYIDDSLEGFIGSILGSTDDGAILTMTSQDPKWSYLRYDSNFLVTEVREKEVISEEATVGIYAFSKGEDFVIGAREMIKRDYRVNGEFYVAPVFNELIRLGGRITFTNIGPDGFRMNGLGTPEDLSRFVEKMKE